MKIYKEINNKTIFTDGGKCFKKNFSFILLISILNAIILTSIYVITNITGLYTLTYVFLIILVFLNMTSYKFITYMLLQNKEVKINEYYFGLRNFGTSMKLGMISSFKGLLWGLLGYILGGLVVSIGYGTYLSIADYSSLSTLFSYVKLEDANQLLEAISRLPNIEIILEISDLVSILGFVIFYLIKGMKKVFVYYLTFDFHMPVTLADTTTELLFDGNKKAHHELNFLSFIPLYFILLGCIGIDKLLVYISLPEVYALTISSFIFFISYSLVLFMYYFRVGTLYLYVHKTYLKDQMEKLKEEGAKINIEK